MAGRGDIRHTLWVLKKYHTFKNNSFFDLQKYNLDGLKHGSVGNPSGGIRRERH